VLRRSSFVGRDADQARLLEALQAGPLVTVVGPGGVGKTRLVEESVARLGGESVICELAFIGRDGDVDAISARLGFASPEAAAVALGQHDSLLVLDNVEHVIDAAAEFVTRALPASDQIRIITTSREPLHIDGERVLALEPLSVPGAVDVADAPSVQLFLDRASDAGASWDDSRETMEAVAELCRRLDGLPLSIELAAARARALGPGDLLATLEQRLDILRRPGRRLGASARRRHDSVRAAIDVSVALLDADERAVFESLGVFAGPFDADLVHRVIAPSVADGARTVDTLASLVDRSLVAVQATRGRTSYRLLELIRDYAARTLDERGTWEEARDRFVDAMVARSDEIVAEGLREWSEDLITRIDMQFPNFVSAVGWCVEHDDGPDRAVRMILPLFPLVHQTRALAVLAIGSEVVARWPHERAPLRAEAISVLATAAAASGSHEWARTLARTSLADPDGTALAHVVAHRALGLAARAVADYGAAEASFAAGRRVAEELGAGPFARELAGFEASALDLEGRGEAALAMAHSMLDDATAHGDKVNEAWARLVAVGVHMRASRWEDARCELAGGRGAVAADAFPWWEGALLRTQAMLAAHDAATVGDASAWEASVSAWRAALEHAVGRGSVGEVALTLRSAAVLAARHGRVDVAYTLIEAAPPSNELTILPELFADEARALARDVPSPATRPDLTTALRQARTVFSRHDEVECSEAPVSAAPTRARLRREGDTWSCTYGGQAVSVRDLKGLKDLAVLLSNPGREVHCLELMGAAVIEGDTGPALDDRARSEYQHRILELERDADEARADNDLARAEFAERELDELVVQLTDAFGLGGRARPKGSVAERARTAVTYRIRAALRRIAEVHPTLGRHLHNAIRTGTWCSYRPETAVSWDVDVR
jgi:predicted ATPase